VQDPWEKNLPGRGLGRDPERTPMQWSAEPHAGFTTGEPWLPVADDYGWNNVQAQRSDPASMLTLHRALLDLRRREPALHAGDWAPVDADGAVLAYLRSHGATRLLVALNLGAEPAALDFDGSGSVVLSTLPATAEARVGGRIDLRGNEGLILRLD
jgi:alpha-glucosidase